MHRIYVERRADFRNEAARIKSELTEFLGITGIAHVRYLNRYDIENISDDVAQAAARRIFSEPQSDFCVFSDIQVDPEDTVILWEFLPGQYDQRADSAEQCLSLLQAEISAACGNADNENPRVRCAKMIIISGSVSAEEADRISAYLINPVDSRKAARELPKTLNVHSGAAADIPVFAGFNARGDEELAELHESMGLAMDMADLKFLREYFRNEGRDPTETEIRVLDTYWSDHCRHTTFNTELEHIEFEDGDFRDLFQSSYENYADMRRELYGSRAEPDAPNAKPVTLMDMACIGAKYLKKHGKLDDLEISPEINACSVFIDVDVTDTSSCGKDGTPAAKTERWLLQFKNETHNHPTEIEPFGGAATCIGGAIRDPLSGRAWVYQAMRVTGAGDPRTPLSQTREGKLPQMKITREAAQGFSSYGNQIGLATGQVTEIYHRGFEAKRMELGAVIAAAPADAVMREEPEAGDCVILIGGGTGRDGIGGATGSSKVHTAASVATAAAEVQKGNAVEERKIQRLFRNKNISRMIRRCNDFGAGGVSVAVGELAAGLEINLDAVPKKYEGLNGTELAISESQERMAIVVREKDVPAFTEAAAAENLNAAVIARVTDTSRLVMKWRGKTIVDISREFLDTAGASRSAKVKIASPQRIDSPLCCPLDSVLSILEKERTPQGISPETLKKAWLANLTDPAVCSQRGLSERFDGSIGAASVLFPMGGKYQSTPEAGMAAKIPVLPPYETRTASLMAFGYDPRVFSWSPWHGAQFAVLQSLAKIAAMGGNPESCRLTFQEYFERLESETSWGKPAAALLGALDAQKKTGTAAIGGKDSMSGTFRDISVPPTLVSFAVATENAEHVVSGAFKHAGSYIYAAVQPYSEMLSPDFEAFKANAARLYDMNKAGKILSMYPVSAGGIAEAVSKMAFGNKIGCTMNTFVQELLFMPLYGSVIIETAEKLEPCENPLNWMLIGRTQEQPEIDVELSSPDGSCRKMSVSIDEALAEWEKPLSRIFPPVSGKPPLSFPRFAQRVHKSLVKARKKGAEEKRARKIKSIGVSAKPRVLLPVFPGTNCEYDMARAFSLAGAETKIVVFRNNTRDALEQSLRELQAELSHANILALSGGFSAGDEPDGSGKFIANVLRENRIAEQIMRLLKDKDGLVLGICNGFQALIKTGLVPYGKIIEADEAMPTLTFNTVGRHISRMARIRTVSAISPWASDKTVISEENPYIAVSHGEGRLIVQERLAKKLFARGQVFSQYVDENGNPAAAEPDNPNGSAFAIEGLTSPDGRVLGKMGHNERSVGAGTDGTADNLLKNIGGSTCQNIFAAGVRYFR
ncbi:MAG: phosphoribosylformylglycinamidine synthase [Bacteroides sp.]|nr:phosphoribosylformylglycinamidine synthase [Prevotella sp.]MCM1407651.1 phosphoribosylformylglycinamidine synthase [Treponema brennaborense]MCM1469199.1 phosphoribosylformylglycinamidine synthase [Bacteroides sp.]